MTGASPHPMTGTNPHPRIDGPHPIRKLKIGIPYMTDGGPHAQGIVTAGIFHQAKGVNGRKDGYILHKICRHQVGMYTGKIGPKLPVEQLTKGLGNLGIGGKTPTGRIGDTGETTINLVQILMRRIGIGYHIGDHTGIPGVPHTILDIRTLN